MYAFDAVSAKNKCVAWIRDWFAENGDGCNAVIGISGGKDSTVAAAMLVEALGKDRVIGVMMPDGEQADIEDSRNIVKHLGIHGIEYDISAATGIMMCMLKQHPKIKKLSNDMGFADIPSQQSKENLPPRIRMATLYLLAQNFNGRVCNTSNLSEDFIGYSTIYGDTAGDFSPLGDFTASEVVEIGRVLGLPEEFLIKPPSDGLCGKTDEEKLGFTYAVLDEYIRTGVIYDLVAKQIIDRMHEKSRFKREPMAKFCTSA